MMSDHWSDYFEIVGGSAEERARLESDLETLWNGSATMREHIRGIPSLNEQRRDQDYQDAGAPHLTQIVILADGEAPPDYDGFTSKSSADPRTNYIYIDYNEIDRQTMKADGDGDLIDFPSVRLTGHEILHIADPTLSFLGELQSAQSILITILSGEAFTGEQDGFYSPTDMLDELKAECPEFFDIAQLHLTRLQNVDFSDYDTAQNQMIEVLQSIRGKTSDEFADRLEEIIYRQYYWDRLDIVEEPIVDKMDRILDEIFGPENPDRVFYGNGSEALQEGLVEQEFNLPELNQP